MLGVLALIALITFGAGAHHFVSTGQYFSGILIILIIIAASVLFYFLIIKD